MYTSRYYKHILHAIISCAYICEIANWAKDNGKSLDDILEEIYDTYGFFKEKLYTIKMEGISRSNHGVSG